MNRDDFDEFYIDEYGVAWAWGEYDKTLRILAEVTFSGPCPRCGTECEWLAVRCSSHQAKSMRIAVFCPIC